jgi:probable rRNA maturation factor
VKAAMTGEAELALATADSRVQVPITISDPAWKAEGDVGATVRRAARAAMQALKDPNSIDSEQVEISILLTGDSEVRNLNRDYRQVDSATNVLAFASGDAPCPPDVPRLLGDVVLAHGTVSREAKARDLELTHHLAHLVVHGVLHLLGYDHQAVADAEAMERTEVRILAGLGIGDPYRRGRPGSRSEAATKER